MGARWVVLAGPGEPLLDSRNLDLIKHIDSLGMRSIVFTNGTLLSSDNVKLLAQYNIHIIFKVHSFRPQIFDFLAGKNNAHSWVKHSYKINGLTREQFIPAGLNLLLERRSDFIKNRKRQFLSIESVITRHNLDCLIEVARFANVHKLGFLPETLVPDANIISRSLIPSRQEHASLFKELKKSLGRSFILSQRDTRCFIRGNPVIWEDGDISCCLVERAKIGNIRRSSLKELWIKRNNLKEAKLKIKNIGGFRNCPGRESAAISAKE